MTTMWRGWIWTWMLLGLAWAPAGAVEPPAGDAAAAVPVAVAHPGQLTTTMPADPSGTSLALAGGDATGLDVWQAPQSQQPGEKKEQPSTSKKKKKKRPKKKPSSKKKPTRRPAVAVTGKIALRVIYDDNFIHYSGDDLYEFSHVRNEGKFRITNAGDWIIRPRLDTTLKTKRLTGKTLQIRFLLSSWLYTTNSVKNNQSYSLRFKHPGWGRDNFELNLYHAPQYYLRTFKDRAPFVSMATPLEYMPFRLASNSATLSYWRRLSREFDGKLALARSIRYYNQPFMENDNREWRFGGYLTWRLHPRLRVRGEYFYSNVEARAADTVAETLENTDDGDSSYERDSYKVSLLWGPKKPLYVLKSATVAGQYQAYYFTSDLLYFEDPFHVGRKDQVYRFEITGRSPQLIGPVSFEGGYRYTKRTSTAAFDTDNSAIGEDKDYTDNRTWIGAEYPF